MNQQINVLIQITTAPVNPRENIENAVRRAFSADFNIQSIVIDDTNPNAVVKLEAITEANAKLGNIEIASGILNTIDTTPFRSIESKILSLKEEAEIYGNE